MPGTGDPLQRMLRERSAELRDEGPFVDPRSGSTRREFLGRERCVGAGAMLAGTFAGSAAASRRERRAQRRQQERAGARVVIVGAGLAGLTCAYRLQRNGIHAKVYEAREDRLGGRCWTVRGFEHDQVSEHGGEFIDTRHVHIRQIVDELGLTLENREHNDTPDDAVRRLWLNGQLRDRDAIFAGFDELFFRLRSDYQPGWRLPLQHRLRPRAPVR